MTDWTDTHSDFTEELQKRWEWYGFTCKQVEKWIEEAGLHPEDADFAGYLRNMGYEPDEIDDLEEERRVYEGEETTQNLETVEIVVASPPKRKIEEVMDPSDRSWKNIRIDFIPQLVKEWQEVGFSYEEIQDWVSIGMELSDAKFCAWLRDEVKVSSEWMLNNGNLELLRSECQQFFSTIQQSPKN